MIKGIWKYGRVPCTECEKHIVIDRKGVTHLEHCVCGGTGFITKTQAKALAAHPPTCKLAPH